jgi:hypothetical protein
MLNMQDGGSGCPVLIKKERLSWDQIRKIEYSPSLSPRGSKYRITHNIRKRTNIGGLPSGGFTGSM